MFLKTVYVFEIVSTNLAVTILHSEVFSYMVYEILIAVELVTTNIIIIFLNIVNLLEMVFETFFTFERVIT